MKAVFKAHISQPAKTLRVFFNYQGRLYGKVPEVDIPDAMLGAPSGGFRPVTIDNVAGEYVLIQVDDSLVTATPREDDPREIPAQLRPKGFLYRWPDRGSRMEYLDTIA